MMAVKAEEKQKEKTGHEGLNEIIQRFKANPLVMIGTLVVLILVIVSFVLVPAIVPSAAGVTSYEEMMTFGYYDKKPIRYVPDSYFAQMRENYEQMGRYYGFNDYQVWRSAFEATVLRTASLDAMAKADWAPTDANVNKAVADMAQFKDPESGKFSLSLYNKLPKSQLLALWNQTRDDLTMSRFVNDEAMLPVSDAEADFIGKMAGGQRSFEFAAFPFEQYPDSEVEAYAKANPDKFRTVHLSQITIGNEKDAQAVLGQINTGTVTFEDAARTHSQDTFAEQAGDAGNRLAYELETLITDEGERGAVLSLKADSVSELVKVPSGYAIFRMEEDPKPIDLANADNMAKVRSYIMDNERGRVEDYMLAQAQVFTADAKQQGFDAVLTTRGIDKKQFGPLPINYGDASLFSTVSGFSQTELASAPTSENFWKTAWSTAPGTPSNPLVLGNNVVVLYPLPAAEEAATAEDETSPEQQTVTTYKSYWASNDAQNSVQSSVLRSKRLEDNFLMTYFALFQGGGLSAQ
jgi:hypothetical protein